MQSNPTAILGRRQRAGLSIRELAELSGVSSSRIGELEAAEVDIRPPTARKLAEALGCEIPDIVTGLVDLEPAS